MARLLDGGVRLNLMSLEALAAAEQQGAELCLAAVDENPSLLAAHSICSRNACPSHPGGADIVPACPINV